MTNDIKPSGLADVFDNLELPDAQMPLHKQRLKMVLLANTNYNRKPALAVFQDLFLRSFFFIKQYSAYSVAVIALFITVTLWGMPPLASPAFAHIVLEVNPALRLTVDANTNVIDFIALNQSTKDIFRETDFRRKRADLAIEEILNVLHEKTLLSENSNIMLVVTPVRDEKIADIEQTKNKAEIAVNRRLAKLNTASKVRTLIVKTDVYSAAEEAGLRPSQFVRLLDHGMTTDALKNIFHYADDPKVDKDYFVSNFEDIAEQITEALDKDVPEDATVSMFREVLAARREGEFRRAIRRLNELLDENLTPKAAAERVRNEMRSRRNVNNVEVINDEDEDSDDFEDSYDQEVLEDKNEQPSGNGMNRNPDERIDERRERLNNRRKRRNEIREHLDDRRERLQEQHESRENNGIEQPDDDPEESTEKPEDSFEQSDDEEDESNQNPEYDSEQHDEEQLQPYETSDRGNIRRNRRNNKQQQDTEQQMRIERIRRQYLNHQLDGAEQKQSVESKEMTDESFEQPEKE